VWRGDKYRLEEGGRMLLVESGAVTIERAPANSEEATPTAVAHR
jgi:hypothetical protein